MSDRLPRAPLAEEEVFSDDEEPEKSKEEVFTDDEESEKEEEQKEMQAIAPPDVLEVEEAVGGADAGSVATPSSLSSQRTLSGIESLPSDPVDRLSPLPAIELPDNILTNYLIVKVERLNEPPLHIVRGYDTGNPSNVQISYGENYTDEFLFDLAETELSRYTSLSSYEAIGGGQVQVSHSEKVVMVYEMDSAKLDSGTGRSEQADVLTQMINTEGFKLDTTDIDPAMRSRPYTVYYVGKDNIIIHRSLNIEGARVGPPPPDMYNPERG